MIIVRLLTKIIVFPLFLVVCFIRVWVKIISRIGALFLGMIYLLMFIVIAFHFCRHEWIPMLFTIAMSFGVFLISFCACAVGMMLDAFGDKLSEILAW